MGCAQGTLTPLLGIGVCVSIQFAVLEYVKRAFAERNLARGLGGPDGKLLGADQLMFAGIAAGLGNGFVSGPVEHIRIREFCRLPLQEFHPFSSFYHWPVINGTAASRRALRFARESA